MSEVACPLCREPGGELVWSDDRVRVILPDEPDYPGFTRVVWQAHVAEMSDLAPADQDRIMAVVWQVETLMREVLRPHKVNLASFGNVVPHLHWHVVPRWSDDRHFPRPVWGEPAAGREAAAATRRATAAAALPAYRSALRDRLR